MNYFKNGFSQEKGSKFIITIIILLMTTFVVSHRIIIFAAENNIKTIVKEGDDLMGKRVLDSYEKALLKYKSALSQEPDNIDYMIKAANALNHIMRVMTNGNAVKIDGTTQDNEKNKSIWSKYGTEAVKYAETAVKKRPDDQDALCAYAESYMYFSSSYGIIQAILKGAAGQYKDNAFALIKKFPKAEEAVGDIYMGAFYIAAPWPLSDAGESEKHIKKVVELFPVSVGGHYYAAIIAIKGKNYETAEKELHFVLDNECTMGPEHDYCGFLKEQAKKGLAIIAEKTKK